ncbi:MAG: Cof-type HAD-IIB family hydrolase [Rikenellaceae bacterium]
MIKAIFLDIDGTLVSFETKSIPASTIEALREAKARGVKIFIATGRPVAFINNLGAIESLSLIDGYVTMNGSYCYVGDEVVFSNPMARSEVLKVSDYCEQQGVACVYVGERRVTVRNSSEIYRHLFVDMLHVGYVSEVSLEEALSYEIFQLSPFVHKSDEGELISMLEGCEVGRWMDDFADIGAEGNTKSLGISKMIERFGIDVSEVMAIGDGGNDISMLSYAGVGVAMGNASDEVKSYADYVTTSVDEGGIACALRHYGLLG